MSAADHGFETTPPNPDAGLPAPSAPATAEEKQLIESINQQFAEMTKSHKATLEAAGVDLKNKFDPRVEAIENQFKTAAETIKDLDLKVQGLQKAATMADEGPGNAQEAEADKLWSQSFGGWLRAQFGKPFDRKHGAFLAASNEWTATEEKREAGAEPVAFDPQNAVAAGGLHADFGPGVGVWARPTFDRSVTKRLVEHTAIRSFARVIQIGTSRYIGVLRNTNRDTIEQTQEGVVATQQTQKDRYEERPIEPYTLNARPGLSRESVEDSVINIEQELRDDVALDFAVDESSRFVNGSGANDIHGFATDTTVTGVNSRAASALDHYDLTNLSMSLRPFYRSGGAYGMSTDALTSAMLEEDGMGRRLWQPSQTEGLPSLLNGWRFFEATELPAVATAAKPVWFANWSLFYRIIDRRGMLIVRDEVTVPGLIILNMSRRVGGRTWLTEAARTLTIT